MAIRKTISTLSIGLFCLASLPAFAETTEFGVADPACAQENQQALNRCALRWFKTADFLRSIIHADLYEELSGSQQTQLVATEKTWRLFREQHCLAISEPMQGGSAYPLLYHSCRARLTNERIADLQGAGTTKLTALAANQRLDSLLRQANLQRSSGQQQWQRYQKQHCQWEALRFSDQPQRLQQCQHRLSEIRSNQLEQFLEVR